MPELAALGPACLARWIMRGLIAPEFAALGPANTRSRGTSVSVTLAFNTIGWLSQNFLFNSVEALTGATFGTEQPAVVRAYTENANLEAAGQVSVTALSAASIGISVSRNLIGWNLADTRLPTETQAFIQNSSIDAAADLYVAAEANQSIDAQVLAGSLALSAGQTGVAHSGAGAVAENKSAAHTRA